MSRRRDRTLSLRHGAVGRLGRVRYSMVQYGGCGIEYGLPVCAASCRIYPRASLGAAFRNTPEFAMQCSAGSVLQ